MHRCIVSSRFDWLAPQYPPLCTCIQRRLSRCIHFTNKQLSSFPSPFWCQKPLLWTKQLADLTILVLGSPKSRTHTPSVKEQNVVKLSIHFVLGELWFSPEFHLPELVPHNPKSTQHIQHLSLRTWPLIWMVWLNPSALKCVWDLEKNSSTALWR